MRKIICLHFVLKSQMDEGNETPKELQPIFKKLCDNLNMFLYKTETSLGIAQSRLDQLQHVLQPWNLSNQTVFDEDTCICEKLKTENSESVPVSVESSLLESISKTLTTAQSLLSKTSKQNTTSTNVTKKSSKVSKTSSTTIKNSTKSRHSLTTMSSQSTKISKDDTSSHNPSCPLFEFDESEKRLSHLSLSDAISITKIPSSLSRTIKHCNTFLESFEANEKESKERSKLNYLHFLETETKRSCAKFEAHYSPGEIFMKYLSALNSYQNNQKYSKIDNSDWIFYKDAKDIESFQLNRCAILTKKSWDKILRYIIEEIIPVLENCDLDIMQKLYIQKMLKTICNFTQSSIPCVPLFKINHYND